MSARYFVNEFSRKKRINTRHSVKTVNRDNIIGRIHVRQLYAHKPLRFEEIDPIDLPYLHIFSRPKKKKSIFFVFIFSHHHLVERVCCCVMGANIIKTLMDRVESTTIAETPSKWQLSHDNHRVVGSG